MTNPEPVSAVIFDLGNVVVNWDIVAIVDSLGVPHEESLRVRQELFEHQHWVDLDHGHTTEASVATQIYQRTGIAMSTVKEAMLAAKTMLADIVPTRELMDDIARAGIPMYCLSNMSRETYAHIKDREFFALFKGIVISGHERCMKPGAEIYQRLMTRYNLPAASTLFIDDSLANVEAARQQGIQAFHFRRTQDCYARLRSLVLR